jgi:hypothetical protein
MDQYKILLEDILVSQVWTLASQLKEEKKRKGVTSTSDFIDEAAHMIRQKKDRVFQALQRLP